MQCMWKKQMLGVSNICCDSNDAKLAMLQGRARKKECGQSPPVLRIAAEERNSSSHLHFGNMSRMSGNITHVSSLLHIERFVRRRALSSISTARDSERVVLATSRLQKQ